MVHEERPKIALSDDNRYRLLVEAVTDYAIYMLDADGNVTSWNPGARRFKGYEAAEIIGKHFSLFYDPADRVSGLPQHGLDTAKRDGKFESEGWRIRKDGTRFWAHVVIDPIISPVSGLIGYAKITRDLTERKAAEDALRRNEQQFKLLVEGVTDYAIYMLDPKGFVSSWNAGAERIKGYAPDEIIGAHFSRFYTAEDRANGEPAKALAEAASRGKFEKEGIRLRKDGSRFWAFVVIDAIYSPDGSLLGFAKITRDVTERKTAERSLEVAREALFQSQKMDAIGQLTGGVAHDFNNLLAAVLGSLELARRRIDDPKVMRLLDNAVEGAKRGATLTQRMLAFARRQELKTAVLDLPRLIDGMSGLLQTSLGPAVFIERHFPERLSPVVADPNQLELAILNLCVNARDAMPDGGRLTLSAHEHERGPTGSPAVCLAIADQGEGMDEETQRRAVEPFFTTKGVGKGTGLGLPMVHGMMEQLGGRMVLKSQAGEGTTVELWLPAAERDQACDVPDVAANRAGDSAHLQLTILVVDDDDLVLSNTAAMLDDLGHNVLEARSGEEALAQVANGGPIDLVITDQAMPGMTGLQLADALSLRRPDLPIILATGFAETPAFARRNLPRLAKPFRQQDLADMISQVQAGRRQPEITPA